MLKRGGIAGIGGAIDSMLKESELEGAMRPHRAVVLWPLIVGDVLAAASEAEVVRGGVLFVRARSTTWANELTFYKTDILQKINQRLGGRVIEDIHFKAGGRRPAKPRRKEVRDDASDRPTDADLEAVSLDAGDLPHLAGEVGERIRRAAERAARAQAWKRAQGWRSCARCASLFPPETPGDLCPLCAVTARA